jgi:spore germination protein
VVNPMKVENHKISKHQYTFILVGAMIGMGFLTLPAEVSKKAHQQGWISVIIGGLYPLFITSSAYLIGKRSNGSDFWKLNNSLYGKTITYIFGLVFFFGFLLIEASVIADFSNSTVLTVASFFNPKVLTVFFLAVAIYSSEGGLKIIGRLSEFIFYLNTPAVLLSLLFLKEASVYNIQPYIQSFKDILSAVPETSYAYSGVEIAFFITAFVTDRKNLLKNGLVSSIITISIYTFQTIMLILFIGWEVTSKMAYPFLFAAENTRIELVSDLRSIFFLVWSGIVLRTIGIFHFIVSYCFSNLFKFEYKKSTRLSAFPVLLLVFL